MFDGLVVRLRQQRQPRGRCADEIVCVPLDGERNADGSLGVLEIGQVMSDVNAPDGQDYDNDDYEQLPKGNIDVSGGYLIWTTNSAAIGSTRFS